MSDSSTAAEPNRTCYICGKDLTGQPRVKDHQGHYYCLACDEAQKDRMAGGRAACAECKRIFRRSELMGSGSDLVCSSCVQLRKLRYKKMRNSGMDEDLRHAQQVQRLAVLVVIMGLLAVISLVVWFWL